MINAKGLSRGQREYFKDSVIKNEENRLLTVYAAIKDNSDVVLYHPTVYTNENYLRSKEREGYSILQMYVNAKNPFYYDSPAQLMDIAKEHELKTMGDLVDHLQKQGYDAIIGENSNGVKEITVFAANQIKSIGNRFPTKSDYSIDNSEEYKIINARNMTIDERLELAKMGKPSRGNGRKREEFGELERKGAFDR